MKPYSIELVQRRTSKPGYLVPIEDEDLGFPIRRVFFISGLEEEGRRGYHGHRETTTQCLVCLQGIVDVETEDGVFRLDSDTTAVVVPPDNYIVLKLSAQAILLVLCSTLHKDDIVYTTPAQTDRPHTEPESSHRQPAASDGVEQGYPPSPAHPQPEAQNGTPAAQ